MTTAEILAELREDSDLAGTLANLEAQYFSRIELAELDEDQAQSLGLARWFLAAAMQAIEDLTATEQPVCGLSLNGHASDD